MNLPGIRGAVIRFCINGLNEIKSQKLIFFIRIPDIRLMNKAVLYVNFNEQTENLIFVHVSKPPSDAPADHIIHDVSQAQHLLIENDTASRMSEDVETLQKVWDFL